MPGLVLSSTLEMPLAQALGAQFALAGIARVAALLLLAAVLLVLGARASGWLVLPLVAAVLGAAIFSTHAAARLEHSAPLLAVSR